MNKKRREKIKTGKALLDQATELITSARDEESDTLDNWPENLQCTERYYESEEAVDLLDEAVDLLNEAQQCLEGKF